MIMARRQRRACGRHRDAKHVGARRAARAASSQMSRGLSWRRHVARHQRQRLYVHRNRPANEGAAGVASLLRYRA